MKYAYLTTITKYDGEVSNYTNSLFTTLGRAKAYIRWWTKIREMDFAVDKGPDGKKVWKGIVRGQHEISGPDGCAMWFFIVKMLIRE